MLTALACQALLAEAARRVGAPDGVSALVFGGPEVGEALVADHRVALVSATGSTRMGRAVAPVVAGRFGRLLLELGGNNAAIVAPSADLDLTVRGIVFSAAGTAGQRCTTLRRVIVHRSIADELTGRLAAAYRTLPIGSPLADGTLVGPLIDAAAYRGYDDALARAQADGGKLVAGGRRVLADEAPDAFYVEPAIVAMPAQTDVVRSETFAPILYVLDLRHPRRGDRAAQRRAAGSVLVDLHPRPARGRALPRRRTAPTAGSPTSTSGRRGRRSAARSAARRRPAAAASPARTPGASYMRRATNTVNYSTELPLAQGVSFG